MYTLSLGNQDSILYSDSFMLGITIILSYFNPVSDGNSPVPFYKCVDQGAPMSA